jgi:hypothetical protein
VSEEPRSSDAFRSSIAVGRKYSSKRTYRNLTLGFRVH